jgi:Ca2+-binding RTX toxin-like protein
MATLTVTANHDFTGENLGPDPIDEIEFTNPAGTAFATFDAGQFGTGNGLIASNVLLTGSAGTNVVEVNSITGAFSAAAWQFSSWDALDQISLRGTNASETITGSSKNDIIRGDDGADNLSGGAGDDQFVASFADIAAGEAIDGGDDIDTLSLEGANFDLTLAGTTVTNVEILEFQFNTSLIASGGQFGGAGDFTTVTGNAPFAQSLTVNGNAVDLSGVTFTNWDGANQTITINGTSGIDTLTGSSKNDIITGGAGSDDLNGSAGDDQFVASSNSIVAGETIDGGDDTDTLSVQGSIILTLAGTTVTNVESLLFQSNNTNLIASGDHFGGAGDFTTVTGNVAFVQSLTVNGNIVNLSGVGFTGWGGANQTITINGTSASGNALTGSSENDAILGGAGIDIMEGEGGADDLDGGDGDDVFIYDDPADAASGEHLDGGVGTDRIRVQFVGIIAADFSAMTLENIEVLELFGSTPFAGRTVILSGTQIGSGQIVTVDGDAITTESLVVNAAPDVDLSGVTFNDWTQATGPLSQHTITINGTAAANSLTGSDKNDTINGGDGGDTLRGGGGDDTMLGGAGDDTAVFSGNRSSYTLQVVANTIVLSGLDGTDTLSSIERLQFADGTIDLVNDGSALFDTLFYLSQNPDVFQSGFDALFHFNVFGFHEGRDPNAFFDTSGYLAVNPDVAASGVNPLDHFNQFGWKQGRDPSASFDTTLYLIANPDVAAAGIDPLEHFLQFGISEGRQAAAAIGQSIVGGFDAQFYLFHNPDVAAAGVDPFFHYDVAGRFEGRNPNAWFDTAGYLSHYTDVAAAGINPLFHYEQVGWTEGRDPSAGFDTLGYLAANPDVAAANINPLDHFLQFGIYEGRTAVDDGVFF